SSRGAARAARARRSPARRRRRVGAPRSRWGPTPSTLPTVPTFPPFRLFLPAILQFCNVIISPAAFPMSDSLRTDRSRALDAAPEADRDAKIEQLLLLGLDYYFAAQYEQAINVWTRALFFDRHHARARAYIERARSTLAERQRESEELLHTGVAAFDRGDRGEARRLLRAAVGGGAPPGEALR